MKLFNKGQAVFIFICMLMLAYLMANFLAYYLNGLTFKAIIINWDLFKLVEILKEGYVPLNVKYQGYKALLIGSGVSLIIPFLGLAAINRASEKSLYGDAKFASLKDILNSK